MKKEAQEKWSAIMADQNASGLLLKNTAEEIQSAQVLFIKIKAGWPVSILLTAPALHSEKVNISSSLSRYD